MSAADIKSHRDGEIARLVKAGGYCRSIAEDLGTTVSVVRNRLSRMGLLPVALANHQALVEARRAAAKGAVRPVFGHCGSRVVKALPAVQHDHSASDLARTLRADRAALAAYDPSHMVACFHAAGLTLEDIEAGLGIPPVEAVAAIRRAHQGHYP